MFTVVDKWNFNNVPVSWISNIVKRVLETTCIKRPTALRDQYSDITALLKST